MRKLQTIFWAALTAVTFLVNAAAEEPAPLRLSDAVKMTLANNPLHKAALADAKAASAGVR